MNTLINNIEDYLDGSLSDEALVDFEERLSKEVSLKKDVLLHSEVNESIRDTDSVEFRKLVGELMSENNGKQQIIRLSFYAVASIIAILSILRLSFYQPSAEKIYTAFYTPYTTNLSIRSDKADIGLLESAYKLYGEGKYQASFEILAQQNSTSNNENAIFYEGLCALELQDFELAESLLKPITKSDNPALKLHAKWYLGLTYLKTNKKSEAIAIIKELTKNNNYYTAKAKKLQKKIR